MSADAFYRLGLRILSRLPDTDSGHVLVVTSARDGEGKSYVAQALAKALAAQCRGPVALVACLPGQAGSTAPGWSDLVDSGQWQESLVQRRGEAEPVLMGSGSSARVATLFRPDAVAAALECLRERFAMTVVDAPSLAGCGALTRHADGSLLVVNARSTRREVVVGALAANPIPADRLLGTVLNQQIAYVPSWLYRWMF